MRRNHHRPTYERFGPDTGHDIPIRVEFTDGLRPLLERFGTHPGFHLVAFTVDETVWSRELAPLAGFYPSVYVGVPWWFLDAPDAIRRFRAAVTETAGFSRTSGFVDDTRAFCSIPARHDMSRRVDAGVLARLVAEHRLDEDEAVETAMASSPISRRGVQAVSAPAAVTKRGTGPPRRTGAARPPRARQLLPRPSGWYTQHAPDAAELGDRRFHRDRSPPLVDDLSAQEGLYTLVSRAADATGSRC